MKSLIIWKEKIMSEFMLTVFFGVVFVFAIKYMLEGLLFLDRVLLIIWFDFDYVEKGREWVKRTKEGTQRVIARLKQKSEVKRKKEDEEAKTIYVIDEGEE